MTEKTGDQMKRIKIHYPDVTEEDRLLYANAVLVNHTPWDFALHFDYLVMPVAMPPDQDVELHARKVAVINIPATLMRGLIEALQSNLEHYESQYGKIDIPKKREQE
jgi:hypothetical protein